MNDLGENLLKQTNKQTLIERQEIQFVIYDFPAIFLSHISSDALILYQGKYQYHTDKSKSQEVWKNVGNFALQNFITSSGKCFDLSFYIFDCLQYFVYINPDIITRLIYLS